MPLLRYKAMDDQGRILTGRIDAANIADLETRLRHMGLDLIHYREVRSKLVDLSFYRSRIQRRDLITFCFHLEQLSAAGVSLLDSLIDLRDSADQPPLREVIAGLVESIGGGKPLSDALEAYPKVFDDIFVNLVRAGERSGNLVTILGEITRNLTWRDEQAALLKQLLMYPMIVGSVVILTIAFLLVYLVPQLTAFIQTIGGELPLHTRILIELSAFCARYGLLLLLVLIALSVAVPILARTNPRFRFMLDGLQLRLFLVGPILRKAILARLTYCFALLIASGITVLECIQICEGVAGNRVIAAATRRAGRHIAEGSSICAGFKAAGLFSPLALRMLRVGEGSGALDTALRNISYFYSRDVKESMARLQALLGPLMTVLLGAILIWVIVSVMGPIYDLIQDLPI